MTDPHRVVIIGDSLFAETLTQMLASSGAVIVISAVATVAEALLHLNEQQPDAVIVAETAAIDPTLLGPLMAMAPDLSVIRANLNADYVQVITSQRIGTRRADLLAALDAAAQASVSD